MGSGCLGSGGDFIYIDEAGRARGKACQIDRNVCMCSVTMYVDFWVLGGAWAVMQWSAGEASVLDERVAK